MFCHGSTQGARSSVTIFSIAGMDRISEGYLMIFKKIEMNRIILSNTIICDSNGGAKFILRYFCVTKKCIVKKYSQTTTCCRCKTKKPVLL